MNRIVKFKHSSIIVFVGFLLSSSLVIYQPLNYTVVNTLPQFIWMFILVATLIFNIMGFIKYFFTDSCSFLLQICEYVLTPVTSFAVVQTICHYKKDKTQDKLYTVFQTYALQICIILLTGYKIYYMNQIFPGQNEKSILQFQIIPRLFRLIKICINCIAILIIDHNTAFIIAIVLNSIDFLIIWRYITFIDLSLQKIILFASFNNILSICVLTFFSQENQFQKNIISQIILAIFFSVLKNPLKWFIEFKLTKRFQSLQTVNNHSNKENQKKKLILLLSCFQNIYSFHQQQKIVLKEHSKNQWSINFLCQIKKIYKYILCYTLNQIITQSKINQNHSDFNNLTKSLGYQDQFQQKIKQNYFQLYGIDTQIYKIMEDKKLFLNFVAFCMDKIQLEQDKRVSWGFYNQFFIILVPKLSSNFVIKKSLYYYRFLSFNKKSMVLKARNKKIEKYLNYYKFSNQMIPNSEEKFMKFQIILIQLKQKLYNICSQEIKFMERLISNDGSLKCFKFLLQKQQNKQNMFRIFEECFLDNEYLNSESFTYLYIFFMVLFCKSIHKTSEKIRQKFIIPHKKIVQVHNNLTQIPIVVCCGLQSKQHKFGQITLTNTVFKKKFGLNINNLGNFSNMISDLIVGNHQKTRHLRLMIESSNFSQYLKKKNEHKTYNCLLKINLQHSNIHIFQFFQVSTRIYYSFAQNLLYICKIQIKNPNIYTLKSCYSKLINKQNSIQSVQKQAIHQQLNQIVQIIKLTKNQLQQIGFQRETDQLQIQNSLNVNFSFLPKKQFIEQQELKKYSKIQENLWLKSDKKDEAFCKATWLALLFCILSVCLAFSIQFVCKNVAKISHNILKEGQELFVSTQSLSVHISLYTNLIRQVQQNKLQFKYPALINQIQDIALQKLNQWIVQQPKKYFLQHHENDLRIVPFFDPIFSESLGIEKDVDYSTYLYQLSATIKQFLIANFTKFTPQQQSQLYKLIYNQSRIDQNSININIFNSASQKINNLQTKVIAYNTTTYIVVTIGTLICLILAIICYIRVYYDITRYFWLLFKIQDSLFYRRINQMKFIIQQIQLMKNNYNFTKCQFLSKQIVNIKTTTLNGLQQNQLNINQFEKLINYKQPKIIYSSKKNQPKNTILKQVFTSKKKHLISILFISISITILIILIGYKNNQIISNGISFNKVLIQGQKTRTYLLAALGANWVSYFKEFQIRTQIYNQKLLNQTMTILQKKQFINIVIAQFQQGILNSVNYRDICTLLNKSSYAFKTEDQCRRDLEEYSNPSMSELMTILIKNMYDIWKKPKIANDTVLATNLCINTKLILNYFQPGILAFWSNLQQCMNKQNEVAMRQYWILLICIGIVFIILFGESLWDAYYRLIEALKFQIFTITNLKNLYNNCHFRPHLNRMLYHQMQFQ